VSLFTGELIDIVRQLPLKWRGLAYLLWVEGRTQAEAARMLGTSRSNVCHKHRRMKEYLRRQYDDRETEES